MWVSPVKNMRETDYGRSWQRDDDVLIGGSKMSMYTHNMTALREGNMFRCRWLLRRLHDLGVEVEVKSKAA
jgi:hypothetical protein